MVTRGASLHGFAAVALEALELEAEKLCAALGCGDPGTHLPGWIVTHMLAMPTRQFCHPVTLFVEVVTDDGLLDDHAPCVVDRLRQVDNGHILSVKQLAKAGQRFPLGVGERLLRAVELEAEGIGAVAAQPLLCWIGDLARSERVEREDAGSESFDHLDDVRSDRSGGAGREPAKRLRTMKNRLPAADPRVRRLFGWHVAAGGVSPSIR